MVEKNELYMAIWDYRCHSISISRSHFCGKHLQIFTSPADQATCCAELSLIRASILLHFSG